MTTLSERPRPLSAPPEPALAAPVPMPLPFSLLMPFYDGDRPEFLRRAFLSSIAEQRRPPAEVVLVQDGPVSDDLLACVEALCAQSPVPVVRVVLPQNVGLARALMHAHAAQRAPDIARRRQAINGGPDPG